MPREIPPPRLAGACDFCGHDAEHRPIRQGEALSVGCPACPEAACTDLRAATDAHHWIHSQCRKCYEAAWPGKPPLTRRAARRQACCFCGRPATAGIYRRAQPNSRAIGHCPDLRRPYPPPGRGILLNEQALDTLIAQAEKGRR